MNEQRHFNIKSEPHRLTLSGDYADAVIFSDACSLVETKPQEQLASDVPNDEDGEILPE